MVELNQDNEQLDPAAAERDEDSRVDMWCSVFMVLLAWAIAIFWVSGQ